MFKKAERKQAKLRMAITGASGSGKTYGALLLANGIGGKIAYIDTEHGSASLYSDLADFDVVNLAPPFTPERYIDLIDMAVENGYNTLVIDSISHEWSGKGGVLEIVDQITQASKVKNSYFAWGKVTPRHNAFIEKIVQSPIHIICTMRSKQDFVLAEDSRGKIAPQKVGLAPIQRDGLEYEFTTVIDVMQGSNLARISKDRTRIFDLDPFKISEKNGKDIIEWLESGLSQKEIDERERQENSITNQDFISNLESCTSIEDLRVSFSKAQSWAKSCGYPIDEIVDAKNKMKKDICDEQ